MRGEGLAPTGASPVSGLARLFVRGATPRLLLLRAVWPQVVGTDVARRTELVAVDADTLRVRVPDRCWQQVLYRMRRQILTRLRDAAGVAAPRGLGFVEGPVASPAPPETPAGAPAAIAPPSPALLAGAAAIQDDELRGRFLASAVRYLARQKRPAD